MSRTFWIFSFYVVFDISTTTTSKPPPVHLAPGGSSPESLVFSINEGNSTSIEFQHQLFLNRSFSLGFRTCRGNSIIFKQTSNLTEFTLKTANRSLVLLYSSGSRITEVAVGSRMELNTWHTLLWRVTEGSHVELHLKNEDDDFKMVPLNLSIENDFINGVDFSSGAKLKVGHDFVGCLRLESQFQLSPRNGSSSSSNSNGSCFLETMGCPRECGDVNCHNNGTCLEGDSPVCSCPPGFTGSTCQERMSDCPCQNGGKCVTSSSSSSSSSSTPGSSTCVCPREVVDLTNFTDDGDAVYTIGFEGELCQRHVDVCSKFPAICIEGACMKDPTRPRGFKCYCPQGEDFRVGEFCQYTTNVCRVRNKCLNGGSCASLGGEKFTCACAPGFTGSRCEVDVDECWSDPCQHGGTCTDLVNSFNCSCQNGTLGRTCETNVDDCVANPCLNGGRCVDRVNGFTCDCNDTGFQGGLCQVEVDECASSPCENDGTCLEGVNGYNCTCHPGYTGANCETDIDECLSSPCLNFGTCYQNNVLNSNHSTNSGYHCSCTTGYTGVNCERKESACDPSPCGPGTCVDLDDRIQCICPPGYEGGLCQSPIDPCLDSPCLNGGTCVDFFPDFVCACPENSGFGGRLCSTRLTGCLNSSCSEGAVCLPRLVEPDRHGHECRCPGGFAGANCSVDTTVNFARNFSLVLSSDSFDACSFKFRTLSPSAHLLTINSSHERLTVALSGGRCVDLVVDEGQAGVDSRTGACSKLPLNSSEWVDVEVWRSPGAINGLVRHPGCPEGQCQILLEDAVKERGSNWHFNFGKIRQDFGHDPLDFVGCMAEVKINGKDLPQDVLLQQSAGKCKRKDQCKGACFNKGTCIDLWDSFMCQCPRGFQGERCSEDMTPVTFGYNFGSSFVVFNTYELFKNADDIDYLDISVIFRTRATNAFLFLVQIQDESEHSNSSDKYISCLIINKSVYILSKLLEKQEKPKELRQDFSKFIDGQKHLLRILYKNSMLSLQVDHENIDQIKVSSVSLLSLSQVIVGGLTSDQRVKRTPRNYFRLAHNFMGSLLDFRINGVILDLTCPNETKTSPIVRVPGKECHNVMEGEVTSNICGLLSPCGPNSTCTNVFFNDFECLCPENFAGKRCNRMTYCFGQVCPKNSTCRDVSNGFECVAAVKIKGSVKFLMDLQKDGLQRARFKVKTKSKKAKLLRLQSRNLQDKCKFSINLINNMLMMRIDGELYDTVTIRRPGYWFDLNLEFTSENKTHFGPGNEVNVLMDRECFIHSNLLEVTLSDDMSNFEGCFKDVRINDIHLPFFKSSQLLSVTSFHSRFLEIEAQNSTLGVCRDVDTCHPNPCANGGTCQALEDEFYKCTCPLEFGGNNCQECLMDSCKKNCSNCGRLCQGLNCARTAVLSENQVIGIVGGTTGGAILLVLVSLVVFIVIKVKGKRANQGVYNPGLEETVGTSVQYADILKIPPEEKLI